MRTLFYRGPSREILHSETASGLPGGRSRHNAARFPPVPGRPGPAP